MNDAERYLVEKLSDAVLRLMAFVEQDHDWDDLQRIAAWRDGNAAVKLKWKMFPPSNTVNPKFTDQEKP